MSAKEDEIRNRVKEFNRKNKGMSYNQNDNLSKIFVALGKSWTTSHGTEVVPEFQKLSNSLLNHKKDMRLEVEKFHNIQFSFSTREETTRLGDD